MVKKSTKKSSKTIIKIPIEDYGLLSNYGYTLKNSHEDRIKAILTPDQLVKFRTLQAERKAKIQAYRAAQSE